MIVALIRFALALFLTTCIVAVGTSQTTEGSQGESIFLRVNKDREIAGSSMELMEINVVTDFGEVEIPLAKIDGIKLHADETDSAVIAFKNGDLVTGKIALEVIKVKTNWGTAHVKTSQIDIITMNRNARFYTDAGGTGWRFSKATLSPGPTKKPANGQFK